MLRTIFLFLLSFTLLNAQKDSVAIKYANTILAKDLSKHLHILASDDYKGRETGKEGQKKAATYLAMQFRNLGIMEYQGAYFQSFPLVEIGTGEVALTQNNQTFEFKKDFYCLPVFDNQSVVNELVYVGFGIEEEGVYNDYKDVDVKGKWLIIFDGEPVKKGKYLISGTERKSKWSQRYEKIVTAKKNEAAGVLFVVNDLEREVNNKYFQHKLSSKEMMLKEDFEKQSPIGSFYVSAGMINQILFSKKEDSSLDKLISKSRKKGKPASKTFQLNHPLQVNVKRKIDELVSENVLAFIEGSDLKDEVVVLTAHYDHIGVKDGEVYNGADDDGSGTVALIELAEAFMKAKAEGHGPRRSILIMPVSGEEKGLLGSQYYTDHPVIPLENTVANLNIDMIGRLDNRHPDNPNYVYLIGADKLSTTLHDISEEANKTYTNIELDYTYNDPNDPNRYYYRSDHYNFAKHQIPVIFYFNGTHEDYHKATDTVEKIDFNKVEKITQLVFYTAWELCNRDERIEVNVENNFKNK